MASGSFNISTGNPYISGYVSWAESSQNVSDNTSVVTVYGYLHRTNSYSGTASYCDPVYVTINIDGTPYNLSFGKVTVPNGGSYVQIGSASKKITHEANGSKSIGISYQMSNPYSEGAFTVSTTSTTAILDTIPRQANITSAPNFNDEQNPTINYENKAGNSVSSLQACISLTGASDDIAYRDISKTGTSYTFNLTETERNVLRNATKNSNSRNVTFFIKTVIGGNTFHSTLTRTLSIVNANPTFTTSNVTYQDINSSVVAITKNNQHIVQNKSNLRINYTGATMKKGATISSYVFELNGVTKYGANDIADFGAVNSSSNLTLTATAIDSRGNRTSVKKTITILPYSVPTALVTLNRLNNYENTTYLTVDGNVSSVNGKNTMAIKYRYKLSGGSYNNFTTISDNVKQTLSFDKNNEYIFNVVVTDAFNEKFDKEYVLGKGVFPFFIDTEKNSVGINCLPTKEKSLEIAGDNGNNETIYGMRTGTWTPIIGALGETDPTATYSIRRGSYIKFGKFIYIQFIARAKITKLNGTNNYACVKGLPFKPKSYAVGEAAITIGEIYQLVTNPDKLAMSIANDVIRIQFNFGSGASTLKTTTETDYCEIGGSGWYEIA